MSPKQEFRKSALKKLRSSSQHYHPQKHLINRALETLLQNLCAKNILLYCPLDLEVDIRPLISSLRRQDRKIFVPKVRGVSFDIVEFCLPLRKNKYGILECKARRQNPKLDVMIVPLLGIDETFRRVGFGKGMYDRFFARLKHKPKVIFITKDLQFSKEILTESHDIRGDYLFCSQAKIKRGHHDRIHSCKLHRRWDSSRRIHLPFC